VNDSCPHPIVAFTRRSVDDEADDRESVGRAVAPGRDAKFRSHLDLQAIIASSLLSSPMPGYGGHPSRES
jgi:hypothetical protein